LSDEIGKLYLSFEYYNPNGILVDGDKCDFLDTCDVYFFICVKNIGSTSCDIYEGKSELYENVNELKFAKMKEIVIPLNSPIGNSVEMGIDIWDFDGLDASDLIARFDGIFQTKSLSMKWTKIPVTRTDLIYQNDVTFKGFARLECPGGSCNKVCVPRKGINTCDAEGNKICEKGLTGPACDQIDYCVENNCADYATCESFPNGYKCICGAYEGARCQKGYDPCQIESPCEAHGQCKAVGPDYKCVCEVGWSGQKCDRPASACESAAQRLSPEAVCLNGGSCVDLQDDISYHCICLQPWSGTRCEVIDTCTEEHCSGHGVCIFSNISQESIHCQCDAGWVGETCNYRSQSPCHKASLKLHANQSMVCLHGGVCIDNPNGVDFSCKCPLGWFGPQCETFFIETLYFIVPVLVGAAAFLIILALCFRSFRNEQMGGPALPPRNSPLKTPSSDEQSEYWPTKF
uniref:Delta-like protein n=1 Tax=Hymenolepis diminuta TaxID=6216 RepID=A0A158QBK9_HYMDI